jgi:hypothetical protein
MVTLSDHLEALDEPSKWAVTTMDLGPGSPQDQGVDVAASILQRTCRAVTDGSYKQHHGTAAFILKGCDEKKAIRGCNVTPGQPPEQCAYRSETGGIIGILTTLEALCAQHSLTTGLVTIGCDCESAIKKLTAHRLPEPHDNHYDMLLDARARIKALPIDIKFKHVEGHQDDKNQGHWLSLDWWALQNILMDAQAKKHWRETQETTPPNHKFKHELYSVLLSGKKLSSFDKTAVYAHTNEKPIRDYWLRKDGVFADPAQFDDINWKAAKVANREQPLGRRRWQAKFMTSHCATGKMMKIRRRWPHAKCPRCGQEEENTRHICQCPDPDARSLMTRSLAALAQWMVDNKTHHLVQSHILALLRQWIANEPPPLPPGGTVSQGLAAQTKLGAWNTIMGRISLQVTRIQERHFEHEGLKRTGHRWTVALIHKLQDISFAMWQHRNDVRIGEPTRHYQFDELVEANNAIDAEWAKGNQGLLKADNFLFWDRQRVAEKSLPLKWEWLMMVSNARAAAAADAGVDHTYDHERTTMREWLLRHNPTATRIRDGPKTTHKPKKRQKKKNTTQKSTKNSTTTTQKRRSNSKTSQPQPPAKRRRR